MSQSVAKPESPPDLPLPVLPTIGERGLRFYVGRLFWWMVDVPTLAVAALAIAGYLGRLAWVCELASHFRVQYGVLLAVSSLLYLMGRRWRGALAAGMLAVANLCLVVSIGTPAPRPTDRQVLRALVANVCVRNNRYDEALQLIREASPDVVLVIEVSFEWGEALHALDVDYPYRRVLPANKTTAGLALLSKLPLEQVIVTMIGDPNPALLIMAQMRVDGQRLTVIGTHPYSPVSSSHFEQRNHQLEDLATLVRRQKGPLILLADLNTSPWSPYFQDLLSATELRDSRQGFGIQASWPADFASARIPIDHCLVSSEIAVHARSVGPDVNSDHFPVIVDFSIWPQAGE